MNHTDDAGGPRPALSGPVLPLTHEHGLPGLVRERTLTAPDAIACEDAGRRLTYRELDSASDAFAGLLAERTGGRRGAVVVRLAPGVDVLVALLGVLKSGCWYLPVALEEPADRVGSMVDDALPVAVVARPADLCAPLAGLPLVDVPAPSDSPLRPLRRAADDDPVYVLFTSGSTGSPKGVLLGSAALCNRLEWMQRQYGLGVDDVVLQKTPLSFDVSGWELFWPLIAGSRCLFLPPGDHRDPVAVAGFIERHRVTTCHFVPSMLAVFLPVVGSGQGGSLRRVFCSGEPLPSDLAVRFHRTFDAELHNLYGPTEAAIDVMHWQVPKDFTPGERVLIGRPIDNTTLYVMDAGGRPVASGTPGELWIGGSPVARGYVNRPDLTAAAFTDIGGDRCYRTGDRVRVAEGGVEYLGRQDDQVKIRGVRIETGEVEHVLRGHPAVAQAVVVDVPAPGRAGAGGGELLAAVVAAPGAAGALPTEAALRAHLRDKLPAAYVPSGIRWVAAIPLGRSGKADRGLLRETLPIWREQVMGGADATDDGGPPEVTVPAELAEMWSALVGGAGGSEGFVSLGGHSLLATRLAGWCRARYGAAVPLRLLLDGNASLPELAAFLAAAVKAPGPQRQPASPPGEANSLPADGDTVWPLAPGQRRLWLWSRLHPRSSAYHVVSVVKWHGDLSVDALRAALADVAGRHDVLRVRIVERDGEPGWAFGPGGPPPLEERTVAYPLDDAAVEAFTAEVTADPIPFDRASLLHVGLLHSPAAAQSCLVLSFHHIIADQQTADLVLADLATAYAARLADRRPVLPPAPGFADHCRQEAETVGSPRWQDDMDHWRQVLSDAPRELSLPFRRVPPDGPAALRGRTHRRPLGAERSRRVRELAVGLAVTPATLLISCVAVVLTAWSGHSGVVLGVPASRRRTLDDERLAGFLVDTLPIRVDVGRHPDISSLLAHVRRRQVDALDHHLPAFDAIVAGLGVPARPTGNPLFQVWVNDLSHAAPVLAMPGLRSEAYEPAATPALFDLNFYLRRDPGCAGQADALRLDLVSAADLVPSEVAAELVDQCLRVLDQTLDDPAADPAAFDLRTDRTALPAPVTAPATAAAGGDALVDRVLRTAQRTPDAVAVEGPDGTATTYRQLVGAVDALAGRLAAAGARGGSLVEVRTARTTALPEALLAVWRTGAAVALVDGTLPVARLDEHHRHLRPGGILTLPQQGGPPVLGAGARDRRTAPARGHVLFTSGSGGRSAAVVAGPEPLRAAMRWYADEFGPGPGDRVALLAGLGHDPLLRDMLVPLLHGGTLVVPPADVLAGPARLFDFLLRQRITVLHATPALLELVLAGGAERPSDRLSALRLVISAGAPLTSRLAARLRDALDATLVNGYGTTETPQIVAWHRVGDGSLSNEGAVPVGEAVPGAELAVLDRDGRPCGVGQLGEVVVCGARLAEGYLDGGERGHGFTADPRDTGLPAFRTGDLGRLDPWGRVHLAGRRDRQVLVHGYRVGLDEVEAVALRHGDVRQARAELLESVGGEVLTLYVTAFPGSAPRPEGLRAHLGAWLPKAAVPATVRVVDSLARNGNHKISGGPAAVHPTADAAPATAAPPAVARLSGYIRQFIDRDLGPDENFFDAGLNSLAVLRLHELLVAEFGAPVAVTDLFTYTTLRSLARYLSEGHSGPARPRPETRALHRDAASRAAEDRRKLRSQLYHRDRENR